MPSIMQDQLGVGEESTPGTPVTVSRFLDFGDEDVEQDIERIEFQGIRPGRRVLGANNWVPGRVGVGGPLTLPVMNKDFGLIFKHALGTVATSTPAGGTLSRNHKCTVGNIDGKALTVQVGRTDVSGTTRAFTYAGCKLDEWELSHDTKGQLMFKATLDGMAESTATALATATYSTNLSPWAYTKAVLTLGGSAVDVTDWSLKASNNLNKERYLMRATTPASKKEQLEGADIREFTGDFTAEFTDLTLYNKFVNGTVGTLSIVYTGAIIEGAIPYSITITLDAVRVDGKTPNVAGPGIKMQKVPFKVLDAAATDGPVAITVCTDQVTP